MAFIGYSGCSLWVLISAFGIEDYALYYFKYDTLRVDDIEHILKET